MQHHNRCLPGMLGLLTLAALAATARAPSGHKVIYGFAPTHTAMVIRRHPESGERHLDVLRWGLVPHFTGDLKAARKPIHGRSETAASSGMFRGALATRRCLVPADAFYE